MQARLAQTEKELEAAKAASAAAGAPAETTAAAGGADGSAEIEELRKKVEGLEQERKEQEEVRFSLHGSSDMQKCGSGTWRGARTWLTQSQKREREVIQVNRVNANMKRRLDSLAAVQKSSEEREARVRELEKEVEALRAHLAAPATAPAEPSAAANTEDQQVKINEAVRAAVAAKEAELEVLHAQALAEARAVASTPASGTEAPVSAGATAADPASIDAAIAPLRAQIATLEKEKTALQAEIEALNVKIKNLEKSARTAEISRKTLERQKADAESRLKKVEDAAAVAPAAEGGLSAAAPAFAPAGPAAGAGPSTGVPTGPARGRGGATGVRGAARGRGTGRGGGNSILSSEWTSAGCGDGHPLTCYSGERHTCADFCSCGKRHGYSCCAHSSVGGHQASAGRWRDWRRTR